MHARTGQCRDTMGLVYLSGYLTCLFCNTLATTFTSGCMRPLNFHITTAFSTGFSLFLLTVGLNGGTDVLSKLYKTDIKPHPERHQ